MLAEFTRQIEAEKKAKDLEMTAKVAAYHKMLKGNAKELERKKEMKEEERKENQRLFELQIAMAEKQVQTLQHFCREPLCVNGGMLLDSLVLTASCKFCRNACVQNVRRNVR